MTTRFALSFGVVTAMVASACGLGDDEFSRAVPAEESVTIHAPESDTGNALVAADQLGERSDFYNFTRKTTRDINHGVRWLVGIIESIVEHPATTREDNRRIWGPHGEGLDPVFYRLVVERTETDKYTYALQYRPKDTDDLDESYVSLIEGNSDVSSGINDGLGALSVFVDEWHNVEPGACATGALHIQYDTTTEPKTLAVDFENFLSCDGNDPVTDDPIDAATYYYARNLDGSGNFQFRAVGDIHEGAHQPAIDEHLSIRSRWEAGGAGRADVHIAGGDLMARDGVPAVQASECWDDFFNLTYSDIFPSLVDITRANQGDPSACPGDMGSADFASDL